jgi:hypothetical protein
MEDLRARILQVLEFHAEGTPPGWPDDAHWPENDGALNADWLKALCILTYGEDDRLHGDGSTPLVVKGQVIAPHVGAGYRDALLSLIESGVLEVTADPEALHGHRFRYTLPK